MAIYRKIHKGDTALMVSVMVSEWQYSVNKWKYTEFYEKIYIIKIINTIQFNSEYNDEWMRTYRKLQKHTQIYRRYTVNGDDNDE